MADIDPIEGDGGGLDAKALAAAFGRRIGEATGRGAATAEREARSLAATWGARAAAMGWSKRKLARLGLSPEAVAVLTGARAPCADVAGELAEADLRLAELAQLVGAVRPGTALMRIRGLSERQRAAGSRYAAIIEELARGAGGAWIEERVDGGGGGRDGGAMRRAMLVEAKDRARAALYGEVALEVVRAKRGDGPDMREPVALLALVDAVCLEDLPLAAVLLRFHWSPASWSSGTLAEALGLGLDMIEAGWSGGQVAAIGPSRGRVVGFGAVAGAEAAE